MKSYQEFIDDCGSRSRSAQTKFDLLVYGVQDNAELFEKYSGEFKEEHYAFDNGNWGVDKKRPTPTEVLLPSGIVSKLHIRPDSPLSLKASGNTLLICHGTKELSEFRFLKRPKFWDYTINDGIPTKRYAQMYGLNCLNFNLYSGCDFQNHKLGCRFCSVKATVDKDSPIVVRKSPEDLAQVCQLATDHDSLDYIIVTGGSYVNSDMEFDKHISVVKAIREHLPWHGRVKGNVSLMPPKDMSRLVELYENGVDNPSFNIEVWPQAAFEKICPGKAKFVGFDHVLASLTKLVEYYGAGLVWSNFVAGIVPIEDMKDGFRFMAERGVIPGANIYHAEVNSDIGQSLGTIGHDYIRELYSYAAELYHKYGYKPFFNASILRNSLANEFYEGLLS